MIRSVEIFEQGAKISRLLLLTFVLSFPGLVHAGTLTLTTYYSAPIGAYSYLKLNPITTALSTPCEIGLFYINSAGLMYFCDGTQTFQSLSPVWAQNGNNIYLSDWANASNINVGIGTSAPAAKLDVRKADGSILLLTSDTGIGGRMAISTTGTAAGADVLISTQFNKQLRLAGKLENPPDDLVITSTGDVGIGMTAPLAKLQVNGNIVVSTAAPTNVLHAARKDYADVQPIIQTSSIPPTGCTNGGVAGTQIRICHNNVANCPGAWTTVSEVACYTNQPPFWYLSAWSACSVTCGGGTQSRTVECRLSNVPIVTAPESNCPIPKPAASQNCNTQCCPYDSTWTSWSGWSACETVGCTQTQTRSCNVTLCPGNTSCVPCCGSETINCYPDSWSFGPWSACSNLCTSVYGLGTMTRTVSCSGSCCNPATNPGNSASCTDNSCCPVNGGWSDWADASCNLTNCTKTRFRTCTNPAPVCGGADCGVANSETHTCYGDQWNESPWSACINSSGLPAVCEAGTMTRSITCPGICCDPAALAGKDTSRVCHDTNCPPCPGPGCIEIIDAYGLLSCDCTGCAPYC